MFQGLSKIIWNFLEKHGVSPWYFIVLFCLFVGYFQISVFKNWENSTFYEKYRAIIYVILLIILIIAGTFYFFNKQNIN